MIFITSRGLPVKLLINRQRWFKGAEYLQKTQSDWPQSAVSSELADEVPEVKRIVYAHIHNKSKHVLDKLASHFSDWYKHETSSGMAHACDYVVAAKRSPQIESPVKREEDVLCQTRQTTADDLEKAESLLIKKKWTAHISERCVVAVHRLDKTSKRYPRSQTESLRDEMLRIGDRLRRTDMCFDAIHQVIIPKESFPAVLIIWK